MNKIKLRQALEAFYNEDIGHQDLTSETIFASEDMAVGTFTAKAAGIVCGFPVLIEGYRLLDPEITLHFHVSEGAHVQVGVDLLTVSGPVRTLLSAERVLLNLLQHMSGIATMTAAAAHLMKGSGTRICDTRKTTPGLRLFEKYAVKIGGGYNHRFGLYDAVMIKDNHIVHAGSIGSAVQKVRAELGHTVKIEVETTSLETVRAAVQAKADIIMFDNCSPSEICTFVQEVPDNIVTEVSGGIDLTTLKDYAGCGADYLSLGCLTHSVKALDISFNLHMDDQ
ncbi:carboxylating nicotinate-nucleotide diphosphorylase [Sporolactobacillus terrae]|uniref:nicotinate-nucleotide diphosphorylase (carboxylating) n=1 Tax=Sporolactobacillus terrae TaxID=269673 RepID=A0ABX5Q4V4_9BACL|nr:carboxylating nicotinate-nucleotide diphosphorylase [Sporolactobacillus terrae]QAA21668.1 nicotinate-nucleotide diphosphorylase (carboxylating) [Sporolactobacillus terrae]QAA24640.1 nicotinate-nucleotide diphosphorylase (carboxylating) [Sporolactobacillus terrae]UAK16476.1 carboxylating nicotinate-nucleotide diphosphorylase [Sporolactobacillus terrae]